MRHLPLGSPADASAADGIWLHATGAHGEVSGSGTEMKISPESCFDRSTLLVFFYSIYIFFLFFAVAVRRKFLLKALPTLCEVTASSAGHGPRSAVYTTSCPPCTLSPASRRSGGSVLQVDGTRRWSGNGADMSASVMTRCMIDATMR